MNFSHKLPAHLGGWPCQINAHGPLGVSVAYNVPSVDGTTYEAHCIVLDEKKLTRIMPAEPTTPYVEGADGRVYRRLPGTNPGTGEALWKSSSGPVLTWAELSQAWEDQQKTQPVVPLTPVRPVQLPLMLTTSDSDAVRVSVAALDLQPVRLDLAANWTYCALDEAEQIAWALLSAVWQVRGGTRVYPAGTFVKASES